MDLFNRILLDKMSLPNTTAFKQLYEFIKFSVSRFFEGANHYPLLFVEALYPTTRTDRSIWEDDDANIIEDYVEDEEQRRKDNEGYNNDGGDSIDRIINGTPDKGHESDGGDSIDRLNNPRGSKRKGYDSDDSIDSIDKSINSPPKRDKGKGRATEIDPDLLETYFQAFDDLGKDNDDDPLF